MEEGNLSLEEKYLELKSLLTEIVEWWEEWIVSENPTEMEDPPIVEAREFLEKIKF